MRGQFFIIGALFVCILLFFGMVPIINIARTDTGDMERLGLNLQREMPHALNVGINGSAPIGVLRNFTAFSLGIVSGHRIDPAFYWVVFQPLPGQVNVSAGNFMGSSLDFAINVSGVTKVLQAANGTVNSTTFAVTGYTFDVTVTADGESAAMTLLTNKTSMYGSLTMERAGNVVRKEILA
jgi:hypothetical protein